MSSDFQRLQAAMDDIHRIGQDRAADSWSRLPEATRATLLGGQISPRMWGLSFGYELGRLFTRHISDPDMAEWAVDHARAVAEEDIDVLALRHVARILAGEDSVMLGSAVFAAMEGVWASPHPPADDGNPVPRVDDPVTTPFDGIVDHLWSSRGDITIGPFRLAGFLELIAGVVLGVLVWVPATLAVTYGLLHGEVSGGNLVKSAIGWLGVMTAILWLMSPK